MMTRNPRHASRAYVPLIIVALGALLAVFFVAQVLNGDRYRTISNASVEAHTRAN